jgi:TetR/AcrR family transcriptional regulator, tetracycline repressor protein
MWGVGTLVSFLGGFVLQQQADRERALSDEGRLKGRTGMLALSPHLQAA